MIGHEVGDEAFVDNAQIIRPAKIDVEEMTADCIPERGAAVVVGDASDFADDGALKRIGVLGDEEESHELKQAAVAVVTEIGVKKERADLGGAVVFFVELEDRDFLVHADHIGMEKRFFDGVGIERLKAADFGDDAAGADDGVGGEVFHDEEIRFAGGFVGDGLEGALGIANSLGEIFAIFGKGGQADAGERGEGFEVDRDRRSEPGER